LVRLYKISMSNVFIPAFNFIRMVHKKTKSYIDKSVYNLKEFFSFHVRPHVMPAYQPIKNVSSTSVIRPIKKGRENFKSWKKDTIKSIGKKISKILALLGQYYKDTVQFLTKWFKTISEFIKKVMAPVKKFFGRISELFEKYIKPLLPKKEE